MNTFHFFESWRLSTVFAVILSLLKTEPQGQGQVEAGGWGFKHPSLGFIY